MKLNEKKLEAWIIYSLLLITLVILLLMYFRLDSSVDETAEEILTEKSEIVSKELDIFFGPVENLLNEEWQRFEWGHTWMLDTNIWHYHYFALVDAHPSIQSVVVADELGNQQFAGILGRTKWFNLKTFLGNKTDKLPITETWHKENGRFVLDSIWPSKGYYEYDPRERVWYKSAMETDSVIWTEPYEFSGSHAPGITIARQIHSEPGRVIALDITLDYIARKTTQINVSPSGAAFVLTDSGNVIGYPYEKYTADYWTLKDYALSSVDTLDEVFIKDAYHTWKNRGLSNEVFNYESKDDKYWARFTNYKLGSQTFIVGVVAPEDELIGPINRTKRMLMYGMFFIVFVSLIVVNAYRQKMKANKLLANQKEEIEAQKALVDLKNEEIIDSINYAKRIQTAILPSNKIVKSALPDAFVLYLPKDIVAGDFYWMEKTEDIILFAAADCTGHGVPGAMVSVVCNNALNRSVREFGIKDPGKILDKTREIVISEFEKSEDDVKDGMDIALCSLEKTSSAAEKPVMLKYAGAHNPLWIIRKDATEVEEIKANKQPIGKFDHPEPFTTHEVELNSGDCFYIFSDGFADQFGGEKGKKFKAANFKRLLLSVADKDIQQQKELIDKAFEDWKGPLEQLDDVCIIGVRV